MNTTQHHLVGKTFNFPICVQQRSYTAYTPDETAIIQRNLQVRPALDLVASKPGNGGMGKVMYLEIHQVIQNMNQVFMFNGWSSHVTSATCTQCEQNSKGQWNITFISSCTVVLKDGTVHSDIGTGTNIQSSFKDCLDTAIKAAASDSRKRACRIIGEYVGNSCYDKEYNKKLQTATKARRSPLQKTQELEQHPVLTSGDSDVKTPTRTKPVKMPQAPKKRKRPAPRKSSDPLPAPKKRKFKPIMEKPDN